MKKLKKFIREKGGWKLFLSTILIIFVGLFFLLMGVVYADFHGDWSKIGKILTSEFAITIYVISGLVILLLFYVLILSDRNKEIK